MPNIVTTDVEICSLLDKVNRFERPDEKRDYDGFEYEIYYFSCKSLDLNGILSDFHHALSAISRSFTESSFSDVFKRIVVLVYNNRVIDIIIDVYPNYRALYFGKKFVNFQALKWLVCNITAKYKKLHKVDYVLKIYNLEKRTNENPEGLDESRKSFGQIQGY